MLAPRSGRALRHDISQQLHHLPETMAGLPQRAATAARRASDSLTDAVSESHHS
jgi:gas vesicle protein